MRPTPLVSKSFLQRCALGAAASLVAVFILSTPPQSGAKAEGMSADERIIFNYANQERQIANVPPLRWNESLAAAARLHSARMARENDISHRFPGEPELSSRLLATHARFNQIAENVGEGPSLVEIHQAWMHSPGHRANLLNPELDSIGIGIAMRGGQAFATQDFSRSIEILTLDEQEHRFGVALKKAGLLLDPNPHDARQVCSSGVLDIAAKRNTYRMLYVTGDLDTLPEKIAKEIKNGRYSTAAVGACKGGEETKTGMYRLSILLY